MYTIIEFDPTTASDDSMDSFIELLDSLFYEVNHEDPLVPKELQIKNFRDPYPHDEDYWWLVYDEQKVVGMGFISFTKPSSPIHEKNKHIAFAVIRLHAEHRGKGLGTQLLKIIVKKSRRSSKNHFSPIRIDNQRPRGVLETQRKISPESRRLQEERNAKKGSICYTIIFREKNGAISGLTEVKFTSETPYKINQNLTGVKQEYRRRGLGKWLKAEMMYYIKEKYPQVRYIRTGNADVNAPMLAINTKIGFKEFHKIYDYKFKLEDLVKKIERL